jgi:hypothetical protein
MAADTARAGGQCAARAYAAGKRCAARRGSRRNRRRRARRGGTSVALLAKRSGRERPHAQLRALF